MLLYYTPLCCRSEQKHAEGWQARGERSRRRSYNSYWLATATLPAVGTGVPQYWLTAID